MFSTASACRRASAAACSFLFLVLLFVAPATAQEALIKGPYIVADVKSGAVYEHHDALRPWFPASTTKLMTVYVILRAVKAGEITLKSPVTISSRAKAQPPSKMNYPVGTVLTFDAAIKLLMVKSPNDIAVALAESLEGNVDAFAERMTREARRIGMDRSKFVNPHGLPDPRQVTTVRDMAILARQLFVEFPQYRDYFGIHAVRVGNRTMRNTNTLMDRYAGATGMKTGFICSSGFNLVASAERDGREIVAVVFGAYNSLDRAERAADLLDQGFRAGAEASAGAGLTLDNVDSGAAYQATIDLRPIICGDGRPEAHAEMFPEPEFETLPNGVVVVKRDGGTAPTRLGAKRNFGPPVTVALGGATGPIAKAVLASLPMPKPRPAPPPAMVATAEPAGQSGEAAAGQADSALAAGVAGRTKPEQAANAEEAVAAAEAGPEPPVGATDEPAPGQAETDGPTEATERAEAAEPIEGAQPLRPAQPTDADAAETATVAAEAAVQEQVPEQAQADEDRAEGPVGTEAPVEAADPSRPDQAEPDPPAETAQQLEPEQPVAPQEAQAWQPIGTAATAGAPEPAGEAGQGTEASAPAATAGAPQPDPPAATAEELIETRRKADADWLKPGEPKPEQPGLATAFAAQPPAAAAEPMETLIAGPATGPATPLPRPRPDPAS